MSDGGVHPEAALHSLASTMLGIEHLTYGPYILLQGVNGVHALWNWKSGVMLTVRAFIIRMVSISADRRCRLFSQYAAIIPLSHFWILIILV